MWRVDDQEAAKQARLRDIQHKNERLASACIPVDYAERVKRATRHCFSTGDGDHRHLVRPPRELYFKDTSGSTAQDAINLASLPVAGDWISTIVSDIDAASGDVQRQKGTRAAAAVVTLPTRLCLNETATTDAALAPVHRLKGLREIDISRCFSLTDESLALLRRTFSSSLEVLNISECRHFSSDVLCQLWRDCYKLHTFVGHGCVSVTDTFLHCVATTKRPVNTSGLRVLDIRRCKNVTSSGISHLASSPLKAMVLTELRMGDCLDVDNMAFFGFENSHCLANLVSLHLSGLRIDETAISWIAKGCTQLESLNLSRCRLLNDFSLLLLSPLLANRIRRLKMKECVLVGDPGLKNLFSRRTDTLEQSKEDEDDELPPVALQVLNLEGCTLVGDDTLRLLGKFGGKLTKLNLRGLRKVSDAGILALAIGCPELISLKISGRHITDQTFKILIKICPRLTLLDISKRLDLQTPECFLSLTSGVRPERLVKLNFAGTNICDVGVSVIATSCNALLWINLSKCGQVGDVAVEALAYCCHKLHVLLLNNTRAITDRSLIACAMMHLPLHVLDVCGNTNITDSGIRAVSSTCQHMRELRLNGCHRLSFHTLQQASAVLPLTKAPMPLTLSQKLATGGGGGSSAVLQPLPAHHIDVIRLLVARFESACVLQAKFRRWKQKEASALFLARRRFLRESRAACKIQTCARRFLLWRRYLRHMQLERNCAAIVYVQAHIRGNQSRCRTKIWRFNANHAAKCIQRGYRLHYQARIAVWNANALTIQRVYRGLLGRRAYQRAVNERRITSGRKIWNWYRKCLLHRDSRARARWLVRKIHNLQGQWRKYKRRQNLTRYLGYYRANATNIQKSWRGFSTRRRVRCLRVIWTAAARRIQRVYRSHRIRCIVRAYRAHAMRHATTLQKCWRRYIGQKRYQRQRRLLIHMQRMARYALAVRKLRRVVEAAVAKYRHEAALRVQRVYRGHLGRRRARLFCKIRNAMYSKRGQNAAQTWIRQRFIRRGAVIQLQRFVRRYQARRRMLKLRRWRRFVTARCLQRYLQAWIRRLRLKRKREAQTHAAFTMQRVYRGHLGRVAFRQEKHRQACLRSVRLLQRVYRGYKGRCIFTQLRREMTSAARRLQRAFRGRNARKVFEIAQASAALKAKEKYDKSILGMLDATRNPMDELFRRAKLHHEKQALEQLHARWAANRVTQECAVRKLTREYQTQLQPATHEIVANHLDLRCRLYGVTENVYVSHRGLLERQARQTQLQRELVDLHRRVAQCKRTLREAVASRRMLDGKEIHEIMRAHRLVLEDVGAGTNNQLDA